VYFLDIQGTLISDKDKSPIAGSIDFIRMLNEKDTPYMLVTNNTKKEPTQFYEYLKSIGFEFDFDKYIDPLMLLEKKVSKDGVAAYGSQEFLNTLVSMGFVLDYKNPKTVLVATKEDFLADEYAQMIDFLLSGASLVGMHETSLYAKGTKRYPGVGAVLKLLEFATSVSYTVVGKPSEAFYNEALQRLQAQESSAAFDKISIVSDDVKGDLGGAKLLGMKTIFVTSGKYKTEQEILPSLEKHLRPDLVFKDMQAILESL
jgi:NagD protein